MFVPLNFGKFTAGRLVPVITRRNRLIVYFTMNPLHSRHGYPGR
jgi:hypothetical protein